MRRTLFAAAALLLVCRAAVADDVAPPVGTVEAAGSAGDAADADDAGNAGDAVADAVAPEGRAAAELRTVTITATRSPAPLADPSAVVSTVGGEELRRSAARTVDDVLRRIPGFSLFRRIGSGAAHPTAQGVSLRGIGPSGTSRALVLVDGVPLNDPFGGWVHWNAIPAETVERVEVLRGSGASLWGNYAMGGVINVITRAPEKTGGSLVGEGGERGSARTEGFASGRFGSTGVLANGRWMRSGDYPLVREDSRGPVDVPGGSEHETGGLRLRQELTRSSRVHLAARGYHDRRDNGTPYTRNETATGFFRGGAETESGSFGHLAADVFGSVQSFESTFSAVAPDRTGESPAADQYSVPSSSAGGSVVWSRTFFERHHLVGGVDALWVDGESKELARYIDGAFTRRREGGATQTMAGVFLEDVASLAPSVELTGALRFDWWQSSDGFRRETDLATGERLVDRDLAGRSEAIVSPRVGLAWTAAPDVVLRGAGYRGFRAPTINEQVRPFRVRNDITEANEGLDAETLWGVEGGVDWTPGAWTTSATLFWNEIDDPIFNVTVGEGEGVVDPCGFVPAGGVCRQRRNLGRTEILGIETEAGVEIASGFFARFAYLWSDGEIAAAKDDPTLVGNRLPQVPRHQGTIAFDYDTGGPWIASLQMRIVGSQYEDDANTRELDGFVAIDAYIARRLGRGFEIFAAAENLFDETVETGRSADGVVGIGAPRLVRAGLRYAFEAGAGGAPAGGSVK